MENWYGLWMESSSKHQELLREAERERFINKLLAALRRDASPDGGRPTNTRESGKLVADRLRTAAR